MLKDLKTVEQSCQKLLILRNILLEKDNFVLSYLSATNSSERTQETREKLKIAVEFSSPNIAKPFHVGHLRSTFLGRFLSNILQSNGVNVTRINYLGDWGNQFGLLAAGYERFGSESLLNSTKIMHLYDVYVKANKIAESDTEFASKAADIFAQMENNQSDALSFWKKCREISISELTEFYAKLGVTFNIWQSESQFAERARKMIIDLLNRNVIERLENGLIGIKVADGLVTSGKEYRFIPLAKSDSATLYLTRDVVAAIERIDDMNFDHIYYVVDIEQKAHFKNLKAVLNHIGRADVASKISHVRFGLINDMSTRQGKTVFVQDMLAKGEQIAIDLLKSTSTTKLPETDFSSVAVQLALSAFLINDMKRSRSKRYSYEWEKILTASGDGGYFLQICHARLCSLEEKCSQWLPSLASVENFTTNTLTEPEARALLNYMTEELHQPLRLALENFEPVYLVNYLFRLGHISNAAHKKLRVVDSEPTVRQARLMLFSTTRMLLATCMQILGLTPLSKL